MYTYIRIAYMFAYLYMYIYMICCVSTCIYYIYINSGYFKRVKGGHQGQTLPPENLRTGASGASEISPCQGEFDRLTLVICCIWLVNQPPRATGHVSPRNNKAFWSGLIKDWGIGVSLHKAGYKTLISAGGWLTSHDCTNHLPYLKLTARAPENGWLEYDRFLLGWPICRDYDSFREGI